MTLHRNVLGKSCNCASENSEQRSKSSKFGEALLRLSRWATGSQSELLLILMVSQLSCNATKVQLKGQAANPSYQGKLYTVEASFEQGTIPNRVSANAEPTICP